MVCPWTGCGGSIRKISTGLEHDNGWVCNICGEFFASTEDYQAKLRKENEWAEAWINWSEKGEHESGGIGLEETGKVKEHDIEKISVEEDIEQVAVAE
jgi:hypothetical protein